MFDQRGRVPLPARLRGCAGLPQSGAGSGAGRLFACPGGSSIPPALPGHVTGPAKSGLVSSAPRTVRARPVVLVSWISMIRLL